ncbi:hypothetical protein PAMC26577_37710 [Caballeronia sordidicola]|uniref:Uncharacterized protein n=1 Tax=Caballeronia sordidicola TaxID=196367 RepID=A0A242M5G2_CABSO|nr:hypothetical protein PAMC26577_37710 [Caballeronia sordidicola]
MFGQQLMNHIEHAPTIPLSQSLSSIDSPLRAACLDGE